MGLHILFHVVECLILPSLLVALGGHAVEEDAIAKSQFESISVEVESETLCVTRFSSSIIHVDDERTNDFPSHTGPCAPKSNLGNANLSLLFSL